MAKVPPLPVPGADVNPNVAPPSRSTANPGGAPLARLIRPRWLMPLALFAAGIVLAPWLAQQLPDLTERPEYRVTWNDIKLDPLPEGFVPVDLLQQVRRRNQLADEFSLLDPQLVPTLAAAFAHHPWIAEIKRVEKSYPPRVDVQVTYRIPVAMVQVKQGAYPIDSQGVLLPPSDFAAADTRKFPVITQVLSNPAGPAGEAWGDPAVLAGARLAEFLGPRWKNLELAAIVVPRLTKATAPAQDIALELQTIGGTRILWGRAPGGGHPGELTAAQKLGRMEKYLVERGTFDGVHGPYEIDIRHWQEITRRPLHPSSTTSAPQTTGNAPPRTSQHGHHSGRTRTR